ncbi:MAG: VOC family protein [Planctomycetota bacterium]
MSTPASPHLNQIGQIAINVHDLEVAVRFYRDTLGMTFLFQVPKLAFFDCGGIRLMLAVADRPEFDHQSSIIYYRVADIAATCAALQAKGVELEAAPALVAKMPTHDLWLALFRDPDHNPVALMSEVHVSPAGGTA